MIDVLLDAVLDTAKLIPFLFLTYLFLEYIEHKTNNEIEGAIEKCGKAGPLIGGLLGTIPQCGFSSVAANFYAGRIITLGTLAAIFISTSDEMLPILIASAVPVSSIIKILLFKICTAVIAGFIIDLIFRQNVSHHHEEDIHPLCEKQGCNCHGGSIFFSSFKHTINISIFIFIICLIFGCIVEFVGKDIVSDTLLSVPVLGQVVAGIIGLIPNCASSVLITQLYLEGLMPSGAMISGLVMNSGVGLAVLFKMNPDLKKNLKITALLFAIAVISGLIVSIFGITF